VAAVLADVDTAPISEPLRATLRLLKIVTRGAVTAHDMRLAFMAGVTRSQIEDALDVAFCFNVITRLADTFQFELQNKAELAGSARHLLKRGYT
jgi:hypothetical protein